MLNQLEIGKSLNVRNPAGNLWNRIHLTLVFILFTMIIIVKASIFTEEISK